LVSCLLASVAHAVPITLNFSGRITSVTFGTAPPGIAAGTAFSGSYTYSSTSLDSNAAPTIGDYTSSGSPFGLSVDVGGNLFSSTQVLLEVANDNGQDSYGVFSSGLFAPGHYLLALVLADPTQTALSNTSLPLLPPSLAAYSTNFFTITNYPSGTGDALFAIRGTVESITTTAVPEPGSLLLISAGVLGWGFVRRRRSKA
jgi:hypothetical protein